MVLFAGASVASAEHSAGKGKGTKTTTVYTLPGNPVWPEGIAVERGAGAFYVSATADGTIFRGTLDDPSADVFLPGGADGRTFATGLKTHRGLLYVAGAATGFVWVYDLETKALVRRFSTGTGGFINDLVVLPNGDAYVTDSGRPVLFRIPAQSVAAGTGDTVPLQPFLQLGPTVQYGPGTNVNGIVASPNGRFLVVVQTNTGLLFRIDLRTQAVTPVDLGGTTLTAGDGLVLKGRTLYVVRNALGQIAKVRLSDRFRSARVLSSVTDPTFRFPTTAALAHGRLLVVNSQFDRRGAGLPPELPYTVSSLRRP
jgi:Cu-Zn family superoxide dismutase